MKGDGLSRELESSFFIGKIVAFFLKMITYVR